MHSQPSQHDQLRRGIVRNRVLAWMAEQSYTSSAIRWAVACAAIAEANTIASGLGRLLSLLPTPPLAPRAFVASALSAAALGAGVGAGLGILVTTTARCAARLVVRMFR